MDTFSLIQPIPYRDPTLVFGQFSDVDGAVLLDSAVHSTESRFTYIAVDPFRVVRCSSYPWQASVDGEPREGSPFDVLRDELSNFAWRPAGAPAPFIGGAVGFFSYELGGVLEALPPPKTTPLPWDMVVGLYDVIAVFDQIEEKAWVVASGFPEKDTDARAARAAKRVKWLSHLIAAAESESRRDVYTHWAAESSRPGHESRVADTIDAIHAGDIYQANITQRFYTTLPGHAKPYDVYMTLRRRAPAPFAAFLNPGDGIGILSASPERFLQCDADGNVETRPIKGTRPRAETPEEDEENARALLTSEKDLAENLMIVDLLRNDLSRVCEPGSVTVPALCTLESFATVHHLVSVVKGRLRPGCNAVDLLKAAFPGGSVTGAPKIKAMEIIHTLEPSARGPYCGAVAWLGFDGAMDSSIIIRTLVVNGDEVSAQAGGGVVAESQPDLEYEESLIKAEALLDVLQG